MMKIMMMKKNTKMKNRIGDFYIPNSVSNLVIWKF